jgi:hypothetical protein
MTAAPLGHERDGQGAGLPQGIDDELLGVRRAWRVQECSGRQRMDGRGVRVLRAGSRTRVTTEVVVQRM